jgi:hypothetical protein
MNFIRNHKFTLIGLFIGAIGGYLTYYFVGCQSDTCSITSSPLNSTIYGSLLGVLVLSSFKSENVKTEKK